ANKRLTKVPRRPGERRNVFRWTGHDVGGNWISGFVTVGMVESIVSYFPEPWEPEKTGRPNRWIEALLALQKAPTPPPTEEPGTVADQEPTPLVELLEKARQTAADLWEEEEPATVAALTRAIKPLS